MMSKNYDWIRIIYQDVPDSEHEELLYGCVSFFKKNEDTPYRSEDPFVVRKRTSSSKPIYYGSLLLILQQVKRLIDAFLIKNQDFGKTLESASDSFEKEAAILRYENEAVDFFNLTCIHMRNLLDLIKDKEVEKKKIPLLNYEKEVDGEIDFRELSNTQIHNRYYFFDGGIFHNVFSDKAKKISEREPSDFTGYNIDLYNYIRGIVEVINSIKVKHLTGVLRVRMEKLNLDSKYQDVILLIQNTLSINQRVNEISSEKYHKFLNLILSDLNGPLEIQVKAPVICINDDLSKKSFDLILDWRCPDGQPETHTCTLRHDLFFEAMDDFFGEEKLLSEVIRLSPDTKTL